LLFCVFCFQGFAQEQVGTPWVGEQGIRQSTEAIMARQREFQWGGLRIRHRHRRDVQDLPLNPESPHIENWPAPGGADAVTSFSPELGFTAATLANTGAFPPDSMGAVGPTQFILAVNGRIRSFNKQTGQADGVLDVDPDVFFQPVMTPPVANNFTSDPRIRYDRLAGRWFAIIIDVPGRAGSLPNRILLAVSDGPIVTSSSSWTYFYFQHDLVSPAGDTGKFADYPTLGVDAHALYIGASIFGTRGLGTFSDTTGFVVRKSSVLGSGPIVVTAFRGLVKKVQGIETGPYTPQGVDNADANATEGYFIGVDAGLYGRLALRRVSNPGGTPAISGNVLITIPLNGNTLTVPHLGNTGGTAGNLDGLDYRLLMAQVRNGRLWTCANIAVNNTGVPNATDTRMGVRWYELGNIASGQTPTVVQSGTVYDPSAGVRNYWMGAINVSGQGHATLGFSVAGANERINAGFVGRLAQDALGSMREPVLYTASASAYNPPGDPGGPGGRRWGDYSYTCIDPNDDMTFWTVQQFCDAPNSYGLRVLRILAPPSATPITCNPSSLSAGASNVTVQVTGLSTNGSAFFDPGAGFSNHVAAAFSGSGVAVQAVNYVDPTHLNLTVSVSSSALAGGRALTITNPDGQTASSAAGILSIASLRIISISRTNNSVLIRWSSEAGQQYRVQYKSVLSAASWQTLPGVIVATGPTAETTDPIQPGANRFYRISAP
jgi:hypothetical protein